MKCWNCGAEIAEGSRFCPNCGADQQQAQAPYGQGPRQTWQQVPPSPTGGVPGGNDAVLKVFAAVCAVLYGVAAVRGLISVFRTLFRFMFRPYASLTFPFALLAAVLNVFMCLVLVMFALKRTPKNSDGLLVLLGIGAAGILVSRFVLMVLQLLVYRYSFFECLASFIFNILAAAFVVAAMYCILRFVMGEFPLIGKSKDALLQEVRETLDTLGQTAGEAAKGARSSWDANQQARQTQWQAQQQTRWEGQQQTRWQGQNYSQPGTTYSQSAPPPNGSPYPVVRLKADRSLAAYILFTFLTCGIYSFYFIYSIAQDVNTACAGDGRQTPGLIKLFLLSFLTCGIYSWFWYYNLGNRLAANAPRYGLVFQENGTTVLLWLLFGFMLCGIGPFVAMHILIKNTNAICGAYNYQHGI